MKNEYRIMKTPLFNIFFIEKMKYKFLWYKKWEEVGESFHTLMDATNFMRSLLKNNERIYKIVTNI